MERLINFILSMLNPFYWDIIGDYDADWDAELNRLLDNYEFHTHGGYTVRIGDVVIWCEDHPRYSFTAPLRESYLPFARPSRATLRKAYKKLTKGFVKDPIHIYYSNYLNAIIQDYPTYGKVLWDYDDLIRVKRDFPELKECDEPLEVIKDWVYIGDLK